MADFSSIAFRPKDWQAFERGCRTLFECIWKDPHAQLNGRSGQRQNGVDIYGHDKAHDSKLVGVQCKGRHGGFDEQLTEKELRAEVAKARSFEPKLDHFIVATTAPNDVGIQEVARTISVEHEAQGLFSVHVYGWDEISGRISLYSAAIRAFHPDATQFHDEIIEGVKQTQILVSEFRAEDQQSNQAMALKIDAIWQAVSSRPSVDDSSAAREATDQVLHQQIDEYRDLLRNGQPRTAIKLLASLKTKVWATASDRVKFRITTNLGAANLQLGQLAEAASLFLDASPFDATDKVGMANRAIALRLQGQSDEAKKAAADALARFPDEAGVLSSFIETRTSSDELTAFVKGIDSNARESPIVSMAISEAYRRLGDSELSRKWSDLAYRSDKENRREVRYIYSANMLARLFESRTAIAGGTISDSDRKALDEAVPILEEVWREIRGHEDNQMIAAIATNLANALRLKGDNAAAFRVVDEALRVSPNEPALRTIRAWLRFFDQDIRGALDDISHTEWKPDTALMRAFSLWKLSRADEALNICQEIENRATEQDICHGARMLSIDINIDQNKIESAEAALGQALADDPRDVEAHIVRARIFKIRGQLDEARDALEAAAACVTADTRFPARYLLAQAYCAQAEPLKAVTLLSGLVDTQRDSEPLKLLIAAAFDADQRKTIKELLDQLPGSLRASRFYARASISYHLLIGALGIAVSEMEKYREQNPGDWEIHLRWMGAATRNGQSEKVRAFIESRPSVEGANAEQRVQFAAYAYHYGQYDLAISVAYENLRQHFNDPEAHMGFIALMLEQPPDGPSFPNPTQIGVDAAFTVRGQDGTESSYIIVDRPDPLAALGEIRRDQALAKRASGLTVGDQLEVLEDRIPPDRRTVTSIQNKFIHVLQRRMDQFENTFPDHDGLQKVSIGEGEAGMAPVLERVKIRAEAIQRLLSGYQRNILPIGVLAFITGSTQISAYVGMVENGTPITVCHGSEPERTEALKLIEAHNRAGCLLDALTLYVARRFELTDLVEQVMGPIHTTQSAKDIFTLHLHQATEKSEQGGMSVFYRDGQYYKATATPEDRARAVRTYESDIDWIDQHCTIVPAAGQFDDNMGRDLPNRMERASVDAIRAAKGSGLIFVSEDFGLRVLPALALLYVGIDAFGALGRPVGKDRRVKEDFVQWADAFMVQPKGLPASGLELYGARCGVLHTLGAESQLSQMGKVRTIHYAWGTGDPGPANQIIETLVKEYPDKLKSEPGTPNLNTIVVKIEEIFTAFVEGVGLFENEVRADQQRLEVVRERARKMFSQFPDFPGVEYLTD
jgi:tetratricopeptide (TPR) repeat protein